jgi:hypothetical protein
MKGWIMKNIIFVLVTIISLAACNGSNKNKGAATNGGSAAGGASAAGTLYDKNASNSSGAIDKETLLGLWESPNFQDNGLNFSLRLYFTQAQVIVTSRCTYMDGVTVYAQASSPVTYSADGVTVLQAVSKEQSFSQNGKDYTCSAEMQAGFQEMHVIQGTIVDDQGFLLTKISN